VQPETMAQPEKTVRPEPKTNTQGKNVRPKTEPLRERIVLRSPEHIHHLQKTRLHKGKEERGRSRITSRTNRPPSSLTDQRQRHCSAEAQRLNHAAGTPSQALPRTEDTKLRNCETRKILETTASRRLIENQDRNSLPKKLDGQRVTPQQEKEKI
jgi:hypothetical protein